MNCRFLTMCPQTSILKMFVKFCTEIRSAQLFPCHVTTKGRRQIAGWRSPGEKEGEFRCFLLENWKESLTTFEFIFNVWCSAKGIIIQLYSSPRNWV